MAMGETCHVRAYAPLPAQPPLTRLMVGDCARVRGLLIVPSQRAAVRQAWQRGHGQVVLLSGQWSRCVKATAEVYSESEENRPGSYEFSEPGPGPWTVVLGWGWRGGGSEAGAGRACGWSS
eukprot:6213767-Pleurochrysis_carterae.AAC.2